MSPVVRLHLLGVVLLALSFSIYSYSAQNDFRMMLVSSEEGDAKECDMTGLTEFIKENINPYEGMDVLSFMASMEKAVETKTDVVILPHAILMERENSILKEYLKKLTSENQILFLAPEVSSKNNIFSEWNSLSMDEIRLGEAKSKDLRIKRKLTAFSKLLKEVKWESSRLKRLKLYM